VQRGIRVDHEVKNNPSAVANIICHTIEKTGPYGVMLFGLQAGEYDNGQTGLIVAEILRLPCITHVMNIKKDADNLIVTHQTDLGIQELQVNTPVVLVVGNTKDANLRIPTIRERLASKNKDIEIIRISELGINNPDKDRRKGGKLFSQIKKRECQMIKGVSGRDKAVSLQKIVNRLNL
jgi:electron transfer flavoprotein beta subunit